MRIAIFGDSFANHALDNDSAGKSWIDIVSEEHEVTNFGVSGSCFQFSYELFLKEYENFDNVIFFVTDYHRRYIKKISDVLPPLPEIGPSHMLNQPLGAENTKQFIQDLNIENKEYYFKIIDNHSFYFDNYRNIEFEVHIHELLVKNIVTLKPKAVIVPCFPKSIISFTPKDTVYTIQLAETASLHVDLTNVWLEYQCLRKCHLCEENNIILGNKILYAMNNGINYLDLDINDFVTKLDKPTEYYLKKHNK